MDQSKLQEQAIKFLNQQLDELKEIVNRADSDDDYDGARERLRRWKDRTVLLIAEKININDAEMLKKKRKMSFIMDDPLRNLVDEVDMYRGFILALSEDLMKHPDIISPASKMVATEEKVEVKLDNKSKAIFIIHGHDELSALKLEKMLRDKWGLEPVILSDEPDGGRTLIEKFENEAQRAIYAFAIFTKDDLISSGGGEYYQARPNTIFELGWFYGRLGRDRVCILFQKGTNVPSDLKGIMRKDFIEKVTEAESEIEKELRKAKII